MLYFLNQQSADILIITDTRLAKDTENKVRVEWGGNAQFASYDSQSRGVTILFKKELPVEILDSFKDVGGNFLAVLIKLGDIKIVVQAVYGPNRDEPTFYSDKVFKKLEDWDYDHAILAGDWNIALNPSLDTKNYNSDVNPKSRKQLLDKMNAHNLLDIFRELNPTEQRFTWKQWGSPKFGRLDYFLTSASITPFVHKVDILPSCYSDHSPISLEIDFTRFQQGRGYWKMNNSLLYNPEYVTTVKNTIQRTTCQYSVVNDNANFFLNASNDELQAFYASQSPESLQKHKLNINPELFLETLMMEIRKVTISFSAKMKRERCNKEVELITDIEAMEADAQNFDQYPLFVTELKNKKAELQELIQYKTQGAYVRARAKYKLEGEKPTKFFCSLER